MNDVGGADVVALRFDEPRVAADLARWCGGEVQELPRETPGGESALIWVPGPDHPRPARLGDWIVKNPDGTFSPCSPADFAARYEPLP